MIYGLKTIALYLLGKDRAERDFAVYPDDTMLVSWPRSGNTWTRFLLANLLHPAGQISFTNIEQLVPDTSSISNRALKKVSRPRFIKTHEYFDHRYPRVIYIVRDPRDVVVSFYNFQRKYRQIPDQYPLENYVYDFVNGKLNSRSWGTWGENVGSWVSARGRNPRFLLLRYEDLLQDTERELKRVAAFLGLAAPKETLDRAIANCSAARMRQMEEQEQNQWVATKKHRKDIPFVGRAEAGGWRCSLSPSSVEQIENAWRELMTSLGYKLTANRIREQA
jgi:hypothetical protein